MWSVRCLPLDDEHERQGSQNPATAGNGSSVWADTLPLGHESVGMTGEAESLMEARIWKYEIAPPDARCRSWVYLDHSAKIISVGLQDDEMVLWALVDAKVEPPEDEESEGLVRLIVANTGAYIPEFPEGAEFLGTLRASNGIVWHVWNGDAETIA